MKGSSITFASAILRFGIQFTIGGTYLAGTYAHIAPLPPCLIKQEEMYSPSHLIFDKE